MKMRFNQFGDGNTAETNGKHVTEFENENLSVAELKLKRCALQEEGNSEMAKEVRDEIYRRLRR